MALAVLLTFLLSPVVGTLQRRGAGSGAGGPRDGRPRPLGPGRNGWALTRQLVTLADELPQYGLKIHQRTSGSQGFPLAMRPMPWRSRWCDACWAEVVAWVDLHRPALLCIGAVAPGGLSQARHLCKRLRSQHPELKIVVGRWGLHDELDTDRQHLLAAGADYVETTVLDTRRALVRVGLTPRRGAPESPPALIPEVV
jgi:hypothetical protein